MVSLTRTPPSIDEAITDAMITEEHLHPSIVFTGPSGSHRYAGLTFGSAGNGQTVIVGALAGPITYTFVNVLGVPAPNNVEVLIQGTLDLTIRKLAQAIQGVNDPANIAYGGGVPFANPDVYGKYTGQRFAIGASQHPAGSSISFQDIVGDVTDIANAMTLITTTIGSTLTAFARMYSTRYLLTGNAVLLNNRMAGPYQTLIPIGASGPYKYDPSIIIVEGASSGAMVIEGDLYWSLDEVTFSLLESGLNLSFGSGGGVNVGSQQFLCNMQRVPVGAGIYIKCRSNGTLITDWVDLKLQIHQYASGL